MQPPQICIHINIQVEYYKTSPFMLDVVSLEPMECELPDQNG